MNNKDYANKEFFSEEKDFTTTKKTSSNSQLNKLSLKTIIQNKWILTCCGSLFILSVLFITHKIKSKKNSTPPIDIHKTDSSALAQNKDNKTKFEFYRNLEETGNNTKVNDRSLKAPPPPKLAQQSVEPIQKVIPKAKSPEIIHPKTRDFFSLQLGSFKKYDDAENLRAKIALHGFESYIETVSLSNGQKWFRVKTKSFSSYNSALGVKNELVKMKFNPILLKNKKLLS